MILPDVNVWVALTVETHDHHRAATAWFDSVSTPGSVRFCRTTHQALLRLVTRENVATAYGVHALTNEQAWQIFDDLDTDSRIGPMVPEPGGTEQLWRQFSARARPSPKLWTDAYLAAFAICARATFVTIDQAFQQFDGLDLHLIEA